MRDSKKTQMQEFVEGFKIMEPFCGPSPIDADHDKVFVMAKVPAGFHAQLNELGWNLDEEDGPDIWTHYC